MPAPAPALAGATAECLALFVDVPLHISESGSLRNGCAWFLCALAERHQDVSGSRRQALQQSPNLSRGFSPGDLCLFAHHSKIAAAPFVRFPASHGQHHRPGPVRRAAISLRFWSSWADIAGWTSQQVPRFLLALVLVGTRLQVGTVCLCLSPQDVQDPDKGHQMTLAKSTETTPSRWS